MSMTAASVSKKLNFPKLSSNVSLRSSVRPYHANCRALNCAPGVRWPVLRTRPDVAQVPDGPVNGVQQIDAVQVICRTREVYDDAHGTGPCARKLNAWFTAKSARDMAFGLRSGEG